MKDKFAINEYITGKDLKRLREMLRMTQEEFADFVNSAGSTVENWERKDGVIKGPIVTLLEILIRKPQLVDWLRLPERK